MFIYENAFTVPSQGEGKIRKNNENQSKLFCSTIEVFTSTLPADWQNYIVKIHLLYHVITKLFFSCNLVI